MKEHSIYYGAGKLPDYKTVSLEIHLYTREPKKMVTDAITQTIGENIEQGWELVSTAVSDGLFILLFKKNK